MRRLLVMVAAAILVLSLPGAALAAPLTGAIFTTESVCDGTNVNIFATKDQVYLDGGPAHEGAAGLPPGEYYVKVTEPNGTLLGTSIGAADETPVLVNAAGEFAVCYQLSAILEKASDASPGYDTTSNNGGEYKVWISPTSDFASVKTDNFKVVAPDGGGGEPDEATLRIRKYYDANANGVKDALEVFLTGWKFHIVDTIDFIRFTPVDIILAPDTYTVTEFMPIETNWINTDPGVVPIQKVITLADGDDETLLFGNVCLGPGGGRTIGFWGNKNGQARMNDGGTSAPELALLSSLNLRTESGANFDPTTYSAFRTWLRDARAVNMAYMLSAQLAAMELNVEAGLVSGSALVYAPGATSANALGFTTITALMAEANTELGTHGVTTSGSAFRAYQAALKDALDDANNNLNFVQATACPFSFAD